MQSFWKPKFFPEFLCLFLKSTLNFEHFQEKDDPHDLRISKSTDCE